MTDGEKLAWLQDKMEDMIWRNAVHFYFSVSAFAVLVVLLVVKL